MKAYISLLLVVVLIMGFATLLKAGGDESLALYFTFDEGKGDKAIDQSGRGTEGEINGGKWVEGKFDKGLEFNGTTDYVKVVANDNILLSPLAHLLFCDRNI